MFKANADDLSIWINGNPTHTSFQSPEEIRIELNQNEYVSVQIISSKHYLGFVRTMHDNVIVFTDGTKLIIT